MSWLRRRLRNSSPVTVDNSFHDASAKLEGAEWVSFSAALLVCLGVAGEVFRELAFERLGESIAELSIAIVANAAVLIGVAVEAYCVATAIIWTRQEKKESDEKIALITKQTAEANARASEADLKAEQLRELMGWRQISDEGEKHIVDVLNSLKVGLRLGICIIPHDAEAQNFAHVIGRCFFKAGVGSWNSLGPPPVFQAPFGVFMCTSEDVHEYKIAAAFCAAGVRIIISPLDFLPLFSEYEELRPNVAFFVAARPIPGAGFPLYPLGPDDEAPRSRPVIRYGKNGLVEEIKPNAGM